MAMGYALRQAGLTPEVTVIEAASEITGMGARAKARVLAAMADLGRCCADRCAGAGGDGGGGGSGGRVNGAGGPVCGGGGAFPHGWISQTDLPQRDGFIEIGRDLGVVGDEALFAVGDCAVMPADPRPKAGVFAVRAAPVLKHNLRGALSGGARKDWHPQRDYLKLISLGKKSALAEKFGVTLAGPSLWRWKDRIDRAFMDRLGDLPKMAAAAAQEGPVAAGAREMLNATPLCGGCGAKVGGGRVVGGVAGIAGGQW